MAKAKKKEMSTGQKVSIGFGLTAAAVSAASAYFLYGSKKASQNRKKVKGWVLKAKGEVLEALEKAEEITAEEYGALVDAASSAYSTVKNASASELKSFKKEMGEHWQNLQKSKALKKLVPGGKVKAKVKKTQQKKQVEKKATAKTAS